MFQLVHVADYVTLNQIVEIIALFVQLWYKLDGLRILGAACIRQGN